MAKLDLYTKTILTIIAVCLVVLCVEEAHWNRVSQVHAQVSAPQEVVLSGFVYYANGQRQIMSLSDSGVRGIPVVVTK